MAKTIIAIAAIIATVLITGNHAIKASERNECRTWVKQAEVRPRWYSTELQRAQCHAYGITLPDVPAYLEVLKREAPETLVAPVQSDFVSADTYARAVKRFQALGYWASEEPTK